MLKQRLLRLLLILCFAMPLCLFASACDRDPATPADSSDGSSSADTSPETESVGDPSTEALTQPITEPLTEAPTEAPTEPSTEADTEADTEAETQVPTLMTAFDMDLLADLKLNSYFTRPSKCEVSLVDDETEGKVVRLSSKELSGPAYVQPAVYISLDSLVDSLGGVMPKTTEYPYLVLKVRGIDLWSHNCGVIGGNSLRDLNTAGQQMYARLDMTEEWQYIYFDLTIYKQDLNVLYFCYEYTSAANGETMDIAEMRLVATREEAEALAGSKAYPAPDRTMEDYTLKVITYNIWAGAVPDWEIRADIFSDFIDTYRPDSIGMQEVSIKWRSLLDSVVFNESYAGVGELRIPGAEYDAIYYRKDKFDLVETGTFWLSDTPDVMGSAHPNANNERICTWARLKDKQTGFEYVHVNTHLDHNGNNTASAARKVRLFQARVILEFIHKLGDTPVVFTGDFNQAPTSSLDNFFPLYLNITGQEPFKASDGTEITVSLGDARADAPVSVSPEEWATMVKYHEVGNTAYNPAHKPIDHIYYSPTYFEAEVFRSIYHPRNGYNASDHIPQYAEFRVKTAE